MLVLMDPDRHGVVVFRNRVIDLLKSTHISMPDFSSVGMATYSSKMQISRRTSPNFSSMASLCTNNRLRKEAGMNDAITVLFAPPWFVYLHNYDISKPILNEILVDSNCVHDVFLSRDIVQTRRFSSEGIYRRVITPSSTPFIVGCM